MAGSAPGVGEVNAGVLVASHVGVDVEVTLAVDVGLGGDAVTVVVSVEVAVSVATGPPAGTVPIGTPGVALPITLGVAGVGVPESRPCSKSVCV